MPQHASVIPDEQLQAVLAQWRRWPGIAAEPRVVRTFAAERDSLNAVHIIRCEADEKSGGKAQEFVLKRHQSNPAFDLAPQEQQQFDSYQNALAAQQLAPTLLYREPDNRYAIFEYLSGHTLREKHLRGSEPPSERQLIAICSLIHRCHRSVALPQTIEPYYLARCERYLESATALLSTARNTYFQEEFTRTAVHAVQILRAKPSKTVFCHHDLNPGNLFFGANDSLSLLDWDFAGPGFASMDFASLGVELCIPLATLARASGIEVAQLQAASKLYAYICALYSEIIAAHSSQASATR